MYMYMYIYIRMYIRVYLARLLLVRLMVHEAALIVQVVLPPHGHLRLGA